MLMICRDKLVLIKLVLAKAGNGDMSNILMENFIIGRALFFVPLSISLSMQ